MDKRKFERYLKTKSKKELMAEIILLSNEYETVQEHFEAKMQADAIVRQLKRYKKAISEVFKVQSVTDLPNLELVQDVITQFQKSAKTPEYIAELMVYALEESVKFARKFGPTDESYAEKLQHLYQDTVLFVEKQGIGNHIALRLKTIVVQLSSLFFRWDYFISASIAKYFTRSELKEIEPKKRAKAKTTKKR